MCLNFYKILYGEMEQNKKNRSEDAVEHPFFKFLPWKKFQLFTHIKMHALFPLTYKKQNYSWIYISPQISFHTNKTWYAFQSRNLHKNGKEFKKKYSVKEER